MTEAVRRASRARHQEGGPRQSVDSSARESDPPHDVAGEESERRLGRVVAMAAPAGTVVVAVVVGVFLSIGQAILVLAAGALFGTVGFLWASLRTLGGQAPLAEGFEQMSRRPIASPDGPAERKRKALRALKDLEFEHAVGKLDDADYLQLSSHYRDEAKAILREIDDGALPQRARAEEIARVYLQQKLEVEGKRVRANQAVPGGKTRRAQEALRPAEAAPPIDALTSEPSRRQGCSLCSSSNEPDAVFCKGCGVRLSPVECSSCSTVNEPDAVFCKRCGRAVEASPDGKADVSR
jgi:hypothetical protein